MRSDEEKAEDIVKKRKLAAKGLKEREDGKPVDPLADADSLDPDDRKAHVDALDDPSARKSRLAALGGIR